MAYTCSISDQGAMHFLTGIVVQWADVFTRKVYIEMVEDSLNFCINKKGLRVMDMFYDQPYSSVRGKRQQPV